MSAFTDEVGVAFERLSTAQKAGIVTQWLIGNIGGRIAIKVRIRDGRTFEAWGDGVALAVDELVRQLALAVEGKS